MKLIREIRKITLDLKLCIKGNNHNNFNRQLNLIIGIPFFTELKKIDIEPNKHLFIIYLIEKLD